MRVTELTKHNAVNKNLNTNSEELQDLLISMSNGKVLNKPSDDPVGAAKVQDFRTSINHSKTLEKNISADKVWLNANEETIKQITNTLKHVKKLALEGANGASTLENRSTLANEIKLITKDLIDLGNKKEGKLYLFSGTKTFTKPLEMCPKLIEPEVKFYGTRIKSAEKIIPLHQDKPLKGILPGALTIYLHETPEYKAENQEIKEEKVKKPKVAEETDQTSKGEEAAKTEETVVEPVVEEMTEPEEGEQLPKKIVIFLDGTESLKQIIEKINKAAIAECNYEKDPHSVIGYKAKVTAEIGIDNSMYLDSAKGINLKFGKDDTGFLNQMKFKVIGSSGATITGSEENAEVNTEEIDPTAISEFAIDTGEYKATFNGYSEAEYQVRVIKGGTFGIAQVIISDDNGKTWSQPSHLQQKIEVFNPDGKASNKIELEFDAKGNPFFREGLEFQFKGNEFMKYNGNDQIKEVIIDNGIKVALNITARQLFKKEPDNTESVDTFDMLNRLSEALEDDDQKAVMKSIGDIDKSINQVLVKRSQVGSTFRELESSEQRIQENMDFKADELSQLENIDLAKGAVDMNKAELKHKVSLDASARLIQPTLINFLR